MHDHLGVIVTGEVGVVGGEDFGQEFLVIGQLPVEAEGKPFPLLDVRPFERLGIASVVRAAGGVPDMADRRPAGVLLHQTLVLAPMAHPENLAHASHVLVGGEQLGPLGIPGGQASRELAAVLDVEEHSRDQPRHLLLPLGRTQGTRLGTGQVINGRQAALMTQVAHRFRFG